jgi:integrase
VRQSGTIVSLTTGRIKGFRFDGRSRDIRWCQSKDSPPGFGVRIYESGRKSYVLQYRPKELVVGSEVETKTIRKKRILKVIGDCTRMSLFEARTRAHKWVDEVDAGYDPEQDRSLEGVTLAQFLPIYLSVKEQEGTAEKSLYDIERRIRNYLLPKYGDRPLTAIKRPHFHTLHLGICSGELSVSGNEAPVEANRLHAHLSNIFKIAEIKGAVPEGTSSPTRLIKKKPEKPRKRFLSVPQLKRLYRVLADEPHHHALYVIQLMCHQGTRKGELLVRNKYGKRLSLKWDHVRLDRVPGRECEPPHLFVGTTKNGDNLFSVLSPQSITILKHLKSLRSGDDVFPVKDIKNAWEDIRAKAGLVDFKFHDLRHCVGTWLGRLGHTELLIGRTLNHRTNSVTQRYSLIPDQDQEAALTGLADWLEETVGPPILRDPIRDGQEA